MRVACGRAHDAAPLPLPGNAARSTIPIGLWLVVEFRTFAADSAIVDVDAMCAHYYEPGPGDPYVHLQKVLLRHRGIGWVIDEVISEWVT